MLFIRLLFDRVLSGRLLLHIVAQTETFANSEMIVFIVGTRDIFPSLTTLVKLLNFFFFFLLTRIRSESSLLKFSVENFAAI